MMVNSISGVRFCAQADTAATGTKKVDADYLNRPGAFTKPEADTVVKTLTKYGNRHRFYSCSHFPDCRWSLDCDS